MTTENPEQTSILSPAAEAQAYERILSLRLDQIRAWSELPDERTDWALETLLDELSVAAIAIRRLRGDRDLPF